MIKYKQVGEKKIQINIPYIIDREYLRKYINSAEANCIYWNLECCKFDGCDKKCGYCDARINRDDVVRKKSIMKELRELIDRSQGHMLYIENDDTNYSEEILQRMMDEIIIRHPLLGDYIDIDATGTGETLITIYERAYSKVVDY